MKRGASRAAAATGAVGRLEAPKVDAAKSRTPATLAKRAAQRVIVASGLGTSVTGCAGKPNRIVKRGRRSLDALPMMGRIGSDCRPDRRRRRRSPRIAACQVGGMPGRGCGGVPWPRWSWLPSRFRPALHRSPMSGPTAIPPTARSDRSPGSGTSRCSRSSDKWFRRPTVHARNLFHLSAAMWDAWAAYDADADGYAYQEKHRADDVTAAREARSASPPTASSTGVTGRSATSRPRPTS